MSNNAPVISVRDLVVGFGEATVLNRASIDVFEGGTAAEGVHITWQAKERAPLKVPVFIAIAIPGEIRFAVPRSAPKVMPADATALIDNEPDQAGSSR